MVTLTYGFGVRLAALAGVMAAPIYNVSPQMGSDIIIVVFAVVVIGGMGSIIGAILTGFTLGIVEGLTKVFFPEASNTVIFVNHGYRAIGAAGRLVRTEHLMASLAAVPEVNRQREGARSAAVAAAILVAFLVAAPFVLYPVFLVKALCFALFACAFNLLIGYVGLLSFGHALFFGWASYLAAYAAQSWAMPPGSPLSSARRRPRSSVLSPG